jgi:N-hydroxyarylamine O-acetyltransferase
MNDLNTLFRKRIGIPEHETITFEMLDHILEKTAIAIPFENICIITKNANDFTQENLINKILIRNEGGLCYDLNGILYLFLMKNGFNVCLVRGVIFNSATNGWSPTGRTHVSILLSHNGHTYLVDTGFGGNLPLKPVPLSGEIVSSMNGEFKVEKGVTEYGDYIFKMKLKHRDTDWRIGYTFESRKPVKNFQEIEEIQEIIREHQQSPFNKSPLITRLTGKGSITLTDTSLTQWIDGEMKKEQIPIDHFNKLSEKLFRIKLSV